MKYRTSLSMEIYCDKSPIYDDNAELSWVLDKEKREGKENFLHFPLKKIDVIYDSRYVENTVYGSVECEKKMIFNFLYKYKKMELQFHPQTFFKFVFEDHTSKYGFKYNLGLNTDTKPFDSSERCTVGGLYYTDIDRLRRFENEAFGDHVLILKIPIVKIGGYKYKSPAVFVESIHCYTDFLADNSIATDLKRSMRKPDLRMSLFHDNVEACVKAIKHNVENFSLIPVEKLNEDMVLAACGVPYYVDSLMNILILSRPDFLEDKEFVKKMVSVNNNLYRKNNYFMDKSLIVCVC